MKKKTKWLKFRHRIVRDILYILFFPYCVFKYKIKVEKFKEQGKRQYLILFNHQTAFDQFFVGAAFKGAVYYVASEDLFSNGWVSSLIKWLVAPIPIKKQATDVKAVMNCIRVAKEGGTIALAPEGNRTYSGKTEYINPAIAPLAKKLGLPIAFYRIEGGYGVHPRWSDVVRKGKMRGFVSKVVEPEEYRSLSNEELTKLICDELYVDEGNKNESFIHPNNAEFLERAFYICPCCKGFSKFESNGSIIKCLKCEKEIKYNENKTLKGIGFDFPFEFTTQWYDYQCDFINSLDTRDYTETPIYIDKANISEVIVYKRKIPLVENAEIRLFGNKIEIKAEEEYLELNFGEISAISVLGKNKLNIYYKDKLYQVKSDKRFNALKYVNIFYRNNNIVKEKQNEQFLGL